MAKLTRRGARNLTATIDRIASAVQENAALLGIDPKIAHDFAYRCDLISDAVETTAVQNFPRKASEAEEIGAEVSGPHPDGLDDADAAGHFTQQEFSELTDVAEKEVAGKRASRPVKVNDYGFNLTK